jgi:hypothetical protein
MSRRFLEEIFRGIYIHMKFEWLAQVF